MNKFFLSLALVSLVFFTACSDDKKESREDICAKGPSKECLAGKWMLNKVEDSSGAEASTDTGTLTLDSDSSFEFKGNGDFIPQANGTWSVDGTTLTINCFECSPATLSGTIFSSDKYSTIKITSSGSQAVVSRFNSGFVPTPVEVFSYIGN